jgi:lysophospholipase L1-like esterase
MAWDRTEVEATVADYLHMLLLELSGQSYNKTTHRRGLLAKLDNRSEGAIELKHQNISAILIELGFPDITGYKPRGHYQLLLREVVEDRIAQDQLLNSAALTASSAPAVTPLFEDFSKLLVDAPRLARAAREPNKNYYRLPVPQKRDYLEREAKNAALGCAGEEFILNFEHFRLHNLGHKALADKVEHVAKTKGDELGYDILSFEPSGRERFIEVKTTAFGKETPFFVSRGEVRFAQEHTKEFHLYRLFEFRKFPKMFDLPGSVESHCLMNPVSYICEFS